MATFDQALTEAALIAIPVLLFLLGLGWFKYAGGEAAKLIPPNNEEPRKRGPEDPNRNKGNPADPNAKGPTNSTNPNNTTNPNGTTPPNATNTGSTPSSTANPPGSTADPNSAAAVPPGTDPTYPTAAPGGDGINGGRSNGGLPEGLDANGNVLPGYKTFAIPNTNILAVVKHDDNNPKKFTMTSTTIPNGQGGGQTGNAGITPPATAVPTRPGPINVPATNQDIRTRGGQPSAFPQPRRQATQRPLTRDNLNQHRDEDRRDRERGREDDEDDVWEDEEQGSREPRRRRSSRRGSRIIGRSESNRENRRRSRPSDINTRTQSGNVMNQGVSESPAPFTPRSAGRQIRFPREKGEIRRDTQGVWEEYNTELGGWIHIGYGSMDTLTAERDGYRVTGRTRQKPRNGTNHRRRSSATVLDLLSPRSSMKKIRSDEEARSNQYRRNRNDRLQSPPPPASRQNTRRSRGEPTEEEQAKARATEKLREKEKAAAEAREKEHDEARASDPKPKDDIFVLAPPNRRGTKDEGLEEWVMDKKNDKYGESGKKFAIDEEGFKISLGDRQEPEKKEEEVPVEWVAVRTQDNKIVHIKASQLQNKTAAEEQIGDIAIKESNGETLTDDEAKMKAELAEVGKELAKINKDEGADLDPDAVETRESRKAEGKRLQEIREKLKTLRETRDDQGIRRLEAQLAKAQNKFDHPELEYDKETGEIVVGKTEREPTSPEEGLLGDRVNGMRRRNTGGYSQEDGISSYTTSRRGAERRDDDWEVPDRGPSTQSRAAPSQHSRPSGNGDNYGYRPDGSTAGRRSSGDSSLRDIGFGESFSNAGQPVPRSNNVYGKSVKPDVPLSQAGYSQAPPPLKNEQGRGGASTANSRQGGDAASSQVQDGSSHSTNATDDWVAASKGGSDLRTDAKAVQDWQTKARTLGESCIDPFNMIEGKKTQEWLVGAKKSQEELQEGLSKMTVVDQGVCLPLMHEIDEKLSGQNVGQDADNRTVVPAKKPLWKDDQQKQNPEMDDMEQEGSSGQIKNSPTRTATRKDSRDDEGNQGAGSERGTRRIPDQPAAPIERGQGDRADKPLPPVAQHLGQRVSNDTVTSQSGQDSREHRGRRSPARQRYGENAPESVVFSKTGQHADSTRPDNPATEKARGPAEHYDDLTPDRIAKDGATSPPVRNCYSPGVEKWINDARKLQTDIETPRAGKTGEWLSEAHRASDDLERRRSLLQNRPWEEKGDINQLMNDIKSALYLADQSTGSADQTAAPENSAEYLKNPSRREPADRGDSIGPAHPEAHQATHRAQQARQREERPDKTDTNATLRSGDKGQGLGGSMDTSPGQQRSKDPAETETVIYRGHELTGDSKTSARDQSANPPMEALHRPRKADVPVEDSNANPAPKQTSKARGWRDSSTDDIPPLQPTRGRSVSDVADPSRDDLPENSGLGHATRGKSPYNGNEPLRRVQGSPNGSSSNAADSSGSWETTDDENTDPHGRLNPYKNSSNGRARSTGSREDHEYIKESPNTAFAQDKLNPNLKESPFAPGSQETLVEDLPSPLPKSDENGFPPHTSGKAGTTNHRNGALPSAANHKTGYMKEQTIGPGDSVWALRAEGLAKNPSGVFDPTGRPYVTDTEAAFKIQDVFHIDIDSSTKTERELLRKRIPSDFLSRQSAAAEYADLTQYLSTLEDRTGAIKSKINQEALLIRNIPSWKNRCIHRGVTPKRSQEGRREQDRSHITDGSDGISRQGGDRGRTVSVADDEPSPTDSRGLRRRGERKGSKGEKDTGEGETQAEQPEAAQRKTHGASPEEEVLTEDRKRNGAQEADQDIDGTTQFDSDSTDPKGEDLSRNGSVNGRRRSDSKLVDGEDHLSDKSHQSLEGESEADRLDTGVDAMEKRKTEAANSKAARERRRKAKETDATDDPNSVQKAEGKKARAGQSLDADDTGNNDTYPPKKGEFESPEPPLRSLFDIQLIFTGTWRYTMNARRLSLALVVMCALTVEGSRQITSLASLSSAGAANSSSLAKRAPGDELPFDIRYTQKWLAKMFGGTPDPILVLTLMFTWVSMCILMCGVIYNEIIKKNENTQEVSKEDKKDKWYNNKKRTLTNLWEWIKSCFIGVAQLVLTDRYPSITKCWATLGWWTILRISIFLAQLLIAIVMVRQVLAMASLVAGAETPIPSGLEISMTLDILKEALPRMQQSPGGMMLLVAFVLTLVLIVVPVGWHSLLHPRPKNPNSRSATSTVKRIITGQAFGKNISLGRFHTPVIFGLGFILVLSFGACLWYFVAIMQYIGEIGFIKDSGYMDSVGLVGASMIFGIFALPLAYIAFKCEDAVRLMLKNRAAKRVGENTKRTTAQNTRD